MARYIAMIDGEAGAYGVAFPDCPGCTAMGGTLDEAIGFATEALRDWMADRVGAGLSALRPRTTEEIRADPENKDAFEAGAIIASIPLLLDSGRSVRANLSLDAGLLESIDDAARRRGLTRSAFIASAAREKIAAGG